MCVPDDEILATIEAWLEIAPFDRRAHQALLGTLARRGQLRDREEHVRVTQRRFEAEGLDESWLRDPLQPAAEHARRRRKAVASRFSLPPNKLGSHSPCPRP